MAHGADFIERYTGLSAELLATGSVPELSAVFRWTYCVEHEKLLTDYDNYEPLSREDVASFSWNEIAKKYMGFLKSILENKNK